MPVRKKTSLYKVRMGLPELKEQSALERGRVHAILLLTLKPEQKWFNLNPSVSTYSKCDNKFLLNRNGEIFSPGLNGAPHKLAVCCKTDDLA